MNDKTATPLKECTVQMGRQLCTLTIIAGYSEYQTAERKWREQRLSRAESTEESTSGTSETQGRQRKRLSSRPGEEPTQRQNSEKIWNILNATNKSVLLVHKELGRREW